MLDPRERLLLTDSLRPPPGFQIDCVITTTYTLDLVTLLTLPLSFTLLAGDGMEEGRVDPIVLLEALRRHADRITVFCDAGHIAVPRRRELLFGYLEGSVVEVQAPKEGGRFHPKLTVVRYTPDPDDQSLAEDEQPEKEAVHYRLLCASRNLTFDRSWDTMLVLDGELVTDRVRAFGRNRPLSNFIEALPGFALRPLPKKRVAGLKKIAAELLRVQFDSPQGFGDKVNDLAFWAIGLDEKKVWPFAAVKERRFGQFLLVSPFVDNTCIQCLQAEAKLFAVVSRQEELDKLPVGALENVPKCFVLADAADGAPADRDFGSGPEGPPSANEPDDTQDTVEIEPSAAQLHGLHAKLFIADEGWNARIWTGSANATSAAFTKNVEFLVELRGKKSDLGIEALLASSPEDGKDRQVRFRDLLTPYQRPAQESLPDPIQQRLERMVDDCCRAVIAARLAAQVVEVPNQPKLLYEVHIEAAAPQSERLAGDVECSIRPISLLPEDAKAITALTGRLATFQGLTFEFLTAFCAVSITARAEGRKYTRDFVLNVPLNGAPKDRQDKLLLAMLSNRERLFRYLLMLLEGPEAAQRQLEGKDRGGSWNDRGASGPFGLPLLEPLLRTLAADKSRLDHVERLIGDLGNSEEGRKLLPEDFVTLWTAIRTVKLERQDRQKG